MKLHEYLKKRGKPLVLYRVVRDRTIATKGSFRQRDPSFNEWKSKEQDELVQDTVDYVHNNKTRKDIHLFSTDS
ncbi:MAG: hypothetical protein GOV15_02660, partial [Candidatus Diapherotrites archaeon]|nr:hypothetical protein [Candidatus Diapherotrites archaeon]